MMRCESFEEVVADLDRRQALDDAARGEALAHAEQCPRCSRSLARARALNADLQTLAVETHDAQAPARVGDALLAALRQQRPAARSAARAWTISAAAAVILLSVLAAGYFLNERRTIEEPPSAQVAVVEREFIPLGYDEQLGEMNSMLVVRVQLTRASLAGLGWPIDAGAGSDPVQADVILGEDGVARAIRLVE